MATKLTTNTFNTTYKDDYSDSDGYYRVLFNSGKALQARELTQMQTMIQSEIARMGNNIFREGAPITPGGVTLSNRYEYIKLNTASNPLPNTPNDLVGKEFTVQSPNPAIKFVVLEVVPAEGSDPSTLYVRYTDTSASPSDGSAPVRVPNGATMSSAGVGDLKAATLNATGVATKASVAKGEYFAQGHFVFVPSQSIFVSKYTSNPTIDIGFIINEQIITAEDDISLYDNQGDNPNRSAPGADRLKVSLTLSRKDEIASDDNFVYVARIDNGIIVDEASGEDAYNVINDVMALRTKEESGNYVVKPFIAKFNETNDTTKLELDVSSGIAYVDGYRLEIPRTKLEVSKPQTTATLEGENVIASYGNYVVIDPAACSNLPDIQTLPLVNLRSATAYGGNTIGTARVRALQEDGAYINYYLFDVDMSAGQSFTAVRSIGTSNSDYADVVLENGVAVLKNTADNSLLFPLPRTRPSSTGVNVTSVTQQFMHQQLSNSTGTIANISPASGYTWTNASDWIICEDDGAVATSATVNINTGTGAYTITGLSNNTIYQVFAYRAKSNPIEKEKILQQNIALTILWPNDADTDADGNRYINLGRSDVIKINDVKTQNALGDDLSFNFIFDNGQRDNFYANGRLVEKGGVTIPAGNIYINMDYFIHGTGGDFFNVNSYDGVVDYDDIPEYTKSTGETINLRDVLDFRPVESTNGNYTGTTSAVFPLPQNTDNITATVQYYLPRSDRLVASVQNSRDGRFGLGEVKIIQGVPSFNAQYPDLPSGSIPLYDIALNPYTLNTTDLTTTYINNKRYTMKDIATLETRLDELTELTTLSLLELNTSSIEVYDQNGLARTKSGFLADTFSNYDYSNVNGLEYRAAIDPAENTLSVQQYPNNIRIVYDQTASNTVVKKGDLLLLNHSDVSFINQALATETENVNPFAVVSQVGQIELSPQNDNWVETLFTPDIIVDGGSRNRDIPGTVLVGNINSFRNSWFGRPVGNRVRVITGSRVIRDLVGQRIVDIEIIPFMRSIKVGFRATGLKPNTRFWPFFNGINVSSWCREESSFVRFSDTTDDPGNLYTNRTAHPSGSTSLIADINGNINGSFVIPSTRDLKFRTGTQIFKLLDISANDEDACTSLAKTTYTAQGTLETVERTIRQTQEIDIRWYQNRDPLAQSFRVDQFENRSGIFITKARLFFASKDPGSIPVEVQIRRVENGIPVSVPINGASKTLNPGDINIPANGNDLTSIQAAFTDFEFDEPVYLAPGQDYAIVILSDSTAYNTYVAKIYEFLIGSTEAKVARQPTLGSLFKSQNARTWTPDQTKDLMFQLFRADFYSAGKAYLKNGIVPKHLLTANPFLSTQGSPDITVSHPGHGFILNDDVVISGLDSASTYAGISGSDINGLRAITAVDPYGYKFSAGSNANSTIVFGDTEVVASKNVMINSFIPSIATLVPDGTSIAPKVKMSNGSSFAGDYDRNSSNNGAYGKDTSFTDITLNEVNTTAVPKIIASSQNESRIAGNVSLNMEIDFTTLDSKVSPIIDLQRATISTFENVIDKQSSSASAGFNVPINYVAETDPNAGSAPAKHITSQINLANSAVGLKVIFAANRPSASEILVYIKTGRSDEFLDTKPWVLVPPQSNLPADEDGTTFRDYEYLAGGISGTLEPFASFQIKLVFNSVNSSKIPTIRDLRAIAMAT